MIRAVAVLLLFVAVGLAGCEAGQETSPQTPGTTTAAANAEATPAGFGAGATPLAGTTDELKAHVASRVGLPPADVVLVSVEPVSWPDACLGVPSPGRVCAQAITPGWRAVLRAPDGTEFRYHGTGGRFVPAP